MAFQESSAPLVAHVIFRLDVGGLENGLINIINHMPVDRYRHAIVCLSTYTDFRKRLKEPGRVPIVAINKREGKDLAAYLRLWRVFRSLRPDIVHTRNLGTLEGAIVAALAGVPRRIHGEHGWDVVDLHGDRRKYRVLRRICRPFVSRYMAVSEHLAGWLTEQVGISSQRMEQIYNGVDSTKFHPHGNGREPLPIPGFADTDTVVVGTVGRMCAVKDQVTLAKAYVRLVGASPSAAQRLRLVMVGDGPLLEDVRRIVEAADVHSHVWLPGKRDDVARLLRGFDVFVLPSLNEGISNTILEAMATGLPVVATDVGGSRELVQSGETGALVPAGDSDIMAQAIETYCNSAELRKRHGRAGRRRVKEKFSMQVMVQGYAALYDGVLGTS